jgi:hypothetical protein
MYASEVGIELQPDLVRMTNTSCCEYSIQIFDDGQLVCLKYREFFTKIKLRNSASCWFYYKELLVTLAHSLQNYTFFIP